MRRNNLAEERASPAVLHDIQPIAKKSYMDPHMKMWTVKIMPGEFYVSDKNEMIVTTLGSCISACIRDKKTGIGGMNHFMLPQSECGTWAGASSSTRYGNFAMEHLINEILKTGSRREDLEAKVFGGSDFMEGNTLNVGVNNARFARDYLKLEKIRLLAEDTGGSVSRKVYYQPETGRIFMKKIEILKNDTIFKREKAYAEQLSHEKVESEVELF